MQTATETRIPVPEPANSQWRRASISVSGINISYLEQGEATSHRPTLVLLHGLMGCAATFKPLLAKLAELNPRQHVIALDLPSAGRSDRKGPSDLASMTHIVHATLQQLGIEQPVLAGHSHGGAIALQLGASYPEFLSSLILFAPAHPYFNDGDPVIRFYLSLPGRIFAYSMAWYPRWLQMLALRRMAGPRSWDDHRRLKPYRKNLRTPGTVTHLLRLLKTWHTDMAQLRELLKRPLRVPSLIVWGDADRAVPMRTALRLREHMLDFQLKVLPGVGHRPTEEQPRVVAGIILNWLEGQRPQSALPSNYNPNASTSQSPMAALMTSSFGLGD